MEKEEELEELTLKKNLLHFSKNTEYTEKSREFSLLFSLSVLKHISLLGEKINIQDLFHAKANGDKPL